MDDAAHAPDVTALVPAHLHDHLGGAIVSGLHDGRVVLVVEGGAAKVNQPDLRVLEHADLAKLVLTSVSFYQKYEFYLLPLLPVLLCDVILDIITVEKQNVLWLQICVSQSVGMQEGD